MQETQNNIQNMQGMQWLGLGDRVCAVTGAAGAIGFEIARQLAQAGAKVALLDRDEARVKQLAQDLRNAGLHACGYGCDVSDTASVQAAAGQVNADMGSCRVLVNNAAAIYADALMNVQVERWNQLLAVNLTGYLVCAQAFGRQMMETGGGGSMIHVGSFAGHEPQPFSGAYSVSKAGIAMLSRLLTVELAEHRIRSNVICPAMVRTPMTASIYQDPAIARRREEMVPAGRISTPIDIAQTVLFFASDRSNYINGQDILLDGGVSQTWLSLIPRPGFEKKDTAPAS